MDKEKEMSPEIEVTDEADISENLIIEDVGTDAEEYATNELDYTESEAEGDEEELDACAILDGDLAELREKFSELSGIESISQLKNPTRYGALRELGLTAEEAYLATSGREARGSNKSHLTSGMPKVARAPLGAMSKAQLREARDVFSDLSDAEIMKLYQKVTK